MSGQPYYAGYTDQAAAHARFEEARLRQEAINAEQAATLASVVGATVASARLFAGEGASGKDDPDTVELVLSDGRTFHFVGCGYDYWGISVEQIGGAA